MLRAFIQKCLRWCLIKQEVWLTISMYLLRQILFQLIYGILDLIRVFLMKFIGSIFIRSKNILGISSKWILKLLIAWLLAWQVRLVYDLYIVRNLWLWLNSINIYERVRIRVAMTSLRLVICEYVLVLTIM